MPQPTIHDMRRTVRRQLALQLATMLHGPSTMPDGSRGTVLDDIVMRSLVGYGFTLELKVRHPEAPEVEAQPEPVHRPALVVVP